MRFGGLFFEDFAFCNFAFDCLLAPVVPPSSSAGEAAGMVETPAFSGVPEIFALSL